jgi:hypothetical protein
LHQQLPGGYLVARLNIDGLHHSGDRAMDLIILHWLHPAVGADAAYQRFMGSLCCTNLQPIASQRSY